MATRVALAIGTLELPSGRITRSDGAEDQLTDVERDLAAYLVARPGEDVARDVLLTEVLGYSPQAITRAVDDGIRRLRAKIERLPERPFHVVSLRGVGYRFVPLDVAAADRRRLRLGPRTVDLDRLEATQPGGEVLSLSATEGRLLEVLVAHDGRPVPAETLLREVWDIRSAGRKKLVDKAVYRLRGKLEDEPREPRFLRTVRGRGLLLDAQVVVETTAVDSPAPPGASSWRRPPAPQLLGRAELLAHLEGLLAAPGLVTLHGAAGLGKTSLASAMGARWAGPCAFCDLTAASTADDVVAELVTALGVDQPRSGPRDVLYAALASADAGLLVFDNAETCSGAVADVWTALRAEAPSLRGLVTSRVLLRTPDERVLPVPPLPSDAASALFVGRAGQLGVDIAGDDARLPPLLDRLDGVPFAIELAASRVRLGGLDGLLKRLDRPLSLLKGRGDAPSLTDALARSWDGLGPDERTLLAVCTTFPGSFVLDAVESALDEVVAFDVIDGLDALLDHALLRQTDDGRIAPTFAVREFVAAHAEPGHRAVAAASLPALRRWYASPGAPVELGVFPPPERVRMLAAELEGALRAFDASLAADEHDVARAIAGWTVPLLVLRGSPHRAMEVARALATALPNDPETLVLCAFAGRAAPPPDDAGIASALRVLEETGRRDLLVRWLSLTLRVGVERAGGAAMEGVRQRIEAELDADLRPLDRARLVYSLGWAAYRAGRRTEAWESLQETLAVYRSEGRAFAAAQVAVSLGGLAQAELRFEESEAFLRMSIQTYERAGIRDWNLGAQDTLGLIRLVQGRYEEADALNRRVYDLARARGNRELQGSMSSRLGTTAAHRGEEVAAATWFELSRATAQRLGWRSQECAANYNLGLLSRGQGRLDEARAHFETARDGYAALGRHPHEAYCAVALADLDLLAGAHDAGLARLRPAIDAIKAADRKVWLGEARSIEARLRAEKGELEALLLAEHAVDLVRGAPSVVLVLGLCHLAEVALRLDQLGDARLAAEEARETLAALGLGGGSRATRRVEEIEGLLAR